MLRLRWTEHARKRLLQGAVTSAGAPLGWMFIEWISGISPLQSYLAQPGLYAYMMFGTLTVFSLFGFYVGNHEANSWALAIRDPLTGAFNRRYFEARLTEELVRFSRSKTPFGLACLDIDHFKNVNDTYGHAVGDVVLKELVNVISHHIRGLDVLSHLGGEEFFILLPAISETDAKNAMSRLLDGVRREEIALDNGSSVSITVSIGLTMTNESDTYSTIMERADKAMYQAKQTGRDRLVVSR